MDCVGAGRFRGGDDFLADQVGFTRRRRPDMHGFVGLAHMQRPGVGVRIDRNGPDAHLARGADDAAGDLAAIGDEEGGDHDVQWAFQICPVSRQASGMVFRSVR